MAEGDEIRRKEKGFVSHLFSWVAVAFCLLLLYVLSIGPVVKLVWTPGTNRSPGVVIMVKFYAPLNWVCENNSVAKDFMSWYLQQIWGIR